ncbi:uncharacterized protein LOC135490013 [Lineus longissimus]|uniref:uncharacterized protein LOC135490013 n=1 Tax=Lineus longissimus TaxID=88925 RepID=UPI00315C8999
MDMLYDQTKTRHVVVRYKKRIGGKEVASEEIGRVQINAKNVDTKAVCKIVGDMNTRTFDGLFYTNFQTGFFVAYKHKTLPYQVQIAVTECEPKTTCICAVAVQSEDDVYVVDRCRKPAGVYGGACSPGPCPSATKPLLRTKMFRNGLLTPWTKILNRQGGHDYKVVLPTTMTVDILVTETALNLIINPSPKDMANSQGLCGFYDEKTSNDFLEKSGTTLPINGNWSSSSEPKKFIESWKLPSDKNSIFYGVAPIIHRDETYCSCSLTGTIVTPDCTTSPGSYKYVNWDKTFKDVTSLVNATSDPPKSGTVHLGSGYHTIIHPTNPQINVTTTPPPPSDMKLPNGKWKKEQDVIDYCKTLMNNVAYKNTLQRCKDVPGSTEKDIVVPCTNSIKRTGKESYAQDSIASAIESCRNNLVKMPTNTSTPWPVPQPLKTCPANCNGKGKCVNAKCQCDAGYEYNDCSIKTTDPTKFIRMDRNGTCDTRKQNCSVFTVQGENIRPNSSCVFEGIKVFEHKKYEKTGSISLLPAVVNSKNEITCLGKDPAKPGFIHPPTSELLKKYPQGISRDKILFPLPGTTPSPSWLHVGPAHMPFDSLCFDCNPKDVTCKRQKKGCFTYDKCFGPGEGVPEKCVVCDPASSIYRLVPNKAQGCGGLNESGYDKKKKEDFAWWILLILLAILLLAALILLCLLCCCCKKRKKKDEKPAAAAAGGVAAEKSSIFAGITPLYCTDYTKSGKSSMGVGAASMASTEGCSTQGAQTFITPTGQARVRFPGSDHQSSADYQNPVDVPCNITAVTSSSFRAAGGGGGDGVCGGVGGRGDSNAGTSSTFRARGDAVGGGVGGPGAINAVTSSTLRAAGRRGGGAGGGAVGGGVDGHGAINVHTTGTFTPSRTGSRRAGGAGGGSAGGGAGSAAVVGGPGSIAAETMSTFRAAGTRSRGADGAGGGTAGGARAGGGTRSAAVAGGPDSIAAVTVRTFGAGGRGGANYEGAGSAGGYGDGEGVCIADARVGTSALKGYPDDYDQSDYYQGVDSGGGGFVARSESFGEEVAEQVPHSRTWLYSEGRQDGPTSDLDVVRPGVDSSNVAAAREGGASANWPESYGKPERHTTDYMEPKTNFEYFVRQNNDHLQNDDWAHGDPNTVGDNVAQNGVTLSSRSVLSPLPNIAVSHPNDSFAGRVSSEYGYLDEYNTDTNSRRSKPCTTDEIGDAMDLDNSFSNATSIYEANINGKPSSNNAKVFLGGLVAGKLIKRARHDEVPLHNTYPHPNDMNINPLFVDDDGARAADYGYLDVMPSGQTISQGSPYEFSRTAYNTNVPMYSTISSSQIQAPMQASVPIQGSMPMQQVMMDQGPTFVQPGAHVMVQAPTQTMQQPAYYAQNQPYMMAMDSSLSPQVRRIYQPQMQSAYAGSNASYGASSATSLLTPGASRYATQSSRGLLLREAAARLRRDMDNQRASQVSNLPSHLDDDEYYFVSSNGLDKLHIPAENVEEYVYEMV